MVRPSIATGKPARYCGPMATANRVLRPMVSGAAIALCLVALSWSQLATAASRPEPLEDVAGCERWTGRAHGNDPTVLLDVRLCPEGAELAGEVQWSSLRSGWNLRKVRGSWSADGRTLTLRDVSIIEDKPKPGWKFCTIDRYQLEREAQDSLHGSYHSKACRDQAKVSLTRQATAPASSATAPPTAAPAGTAPAPTAGGSEPAAPPAGSVEAPPSRDDGGVRIGCGACAAGHRRTTSSWSAVLALTLLALQRSRRRPN